MTQSSRRVLAINQAKDGIVHSYGEGTLIEGKVHPVLGMPNPFIQLDRGGHVWGCECWWGPVDAVRDRFAEEKGWRWEEVSAPSQSDESQSA